MSDLAEHWLTLPLVPYGRPSFAYRGLSMNLTVMSWSHVQRFTLENVGDRWLVGLEFKLITSIYLVIDFYSTIKCHDFERMSTCFIPFDRPWWALQLCFWVCCDLMKRLMGNWRKLPARESHLAGAGAISRFCGRNFDQIIFHSKDFW